MITSCAHKESGRNCPISKTPCLGECIYANILDDISLGIIGLDVSSSEVFFQNKMAIEIFRGVIPPRDYRAIATLLFPQGESLLRPDDFAVPKVLRFANRFIGYTIYNIGATYLWIYLTDITEKARLDAIAQAVNTMNNLGYIFSGIRHELGNPVNAIKTTMTVLKSNLSHCTRETIADYIDRVLSDLNRVEFLLRDLKNFSMYETPELRNVHIASFIENLLSIAGRDFSSKNIRLRTMLRAEADIGYFDPRALQQVLLNILTNAADSLGGRPSPEIAISTLRQTDRVIITVKDNGCGIPDAQKRHLFQPFNTTKPNGTGLGLVIVQKMLSKMDGTVEIESDEHLGTTVTLNLPAGRSGIA